MADPAISILIDSSGAEAGAAKVNSALESIIRQAAEVTRAMAGLKTALAAATKRAASSTGLKAALDQDLSATKAALAQQVAAHKAAEEQKTRITKSESAKRQSIGGGQGKSAPATSPTSPASQTPSAPAKPGKSSAPKGSAPQGNPQLDALKAQVSDIGAAMSKITLPKISAAGITSELKSVDREIAKLGKVDLSKMADGGAAEIKRIEDRVAGLTHRMAEYQQAVKNAPRNNPQFAGLKEQIAQVSAEMAKVAAPKISTADITSQIKSVEREIAKLGKADLSAMGDSGAASIGKIQIRIAELNRQMEEYKRLVEATAHLTSANPVGPATVTQAKSAEKLRQARAVGAPSEASPDFVGPTQAAFEAYKKTERDKVEVARQAAKDMDALRAQAERDNRAYDQRQIANAKAAAKAAAVVDAERRAAMPSANSTSFSGPMPQTVAQASKARVQSVAQSDIGPPMAGTKRALEESAAAAKKLGQSIDGVGAKKAQIGPLGESFKQLKGTFDGLTNVVNIARGAMVAFGAVGLARETVLMADGFTVLEQRIKTATDKTGDFAEMNTRLFNTAQKNGVAFRDTVSVFQNLSRAAPELDATNQDMVRLTDIVQKLGTIGGSTGDELRYALRQFGQAMSMGSLRAEEMNSLLENTPEIANAIAAGMGKTTGQLRQAVLEGKVLSKDVFAALMKQGEQVDRRFANMAPNLAQAMSRIRNGLEKALGESAGGMTTELAKGLSALGDNMGTVINVAASLGVVLAGVFGGRVIGSMTTGIASAVSKQLDLSNAMKVTRAEALTTAQGFMTYAKAQEAAARQAVLTAEANVAAAKRSAAATAASSEASAIIAVTGQGAAKTGASGAETAGATAAVGLAAAQADLAKKQEAVQNAAAQTARATEQLTKAQLAATVAGRAFTGVMNGLRAVVAGLGGPVGILLTALSIGFALYSSRTDKAAEAQAEFNDTLVHFVDLQAKIKANDTAPAARENAIAQQANILAKLQKDLEAAQAQLKQKQDNSTVTGASGNLASNIFGGIDVITGDVFELQKKYDEQRLGGLKAYIREIKANQTILDQVKDPTKYQDSFMRGIPESAKPVVEDKATIKYKQLRTDLTEQISLQRRLNATFADGAASVAAFKQQMELASKIRAIPDDLAANQKADLEDYIKAQQKLEQETEEKQAQASVDQEVKDQSAIARAMGGAPPAARKAEARIAARQQADALGFTDETDPGGTKRKELEKAHLAVASQQTAGDFNSEARNSKIALDTETKRLRAMQLVGVARDIEMAKIDKEADLIGQFGSAAGKGAQKMIEQAGAAAKMRAEGELLAAAMDAQNQAVGATKLTGTGEIEGENRNGQIASLEKQIELEGRYGDVLDENAKKIIEAVGIQKQMEDIRAQGEDLRGMKMDTEGMQEQIRLLETTTENQRIEAAGLQKGIELKKQYGDASSELAQKLIEQAKAQEKINIELEKARALQGMKLETGAIGDIGRAQIDPNLGNEDRAAVIASRQKELELMQQYGDVSDANSQAMIAEAGQQARLTEYYNQHNDALAQMAMQGRDSYGMLRDAAASSLGHVEDLLVDVITGSSSAKEAFANFAKAMAADLARMAIQMMIIRPLAGMLMGGLAGPGIAMAAPSAAFVGPMPLAHSGGVIGVDSLGTRSMPSLNLASLPKYHTGGIVGGEQPAMLKRGEGVFTEAQMRALAPSGGGSNVTIAPQINVTQPQGATAEDGQRFGKAMSRQIEQVINDALTKNLRNGGILNPAGRTRV